MKQGMLGAMPRKNMYEQISSGIAEKMDTAYYFKEFHENGK